MAVYDHLEIPDSPPSPWADVMGSSYIANTSVIAITNSDGTITQALGSFTIVDGSVSSGTISELRRTSSEGGTVETITGLALDAPTFVSTAAAERLALAFTGADTLDGFAGNDDLRGGPQNDTLIGRGGDDILEGGAGADTLAGSAGFDYASYRTAPTAIVANLLNQVNNTGEAAGDTYSALEGLIGSAFDDILTGNTATNTLQGGGGNDVLQGRAGADLLDGGDGFDYAQYAVSTGVVASLSDPSLNAGDAAGDTYLSIEGLIGSSFADTLTGTAGGNTLQGAGGSDLLQGGGGADVLDGGSGLDRASYGNAPTAVIASLSNPAANTGDAAGDTYLSIEGLIGSAFDDTLTGSAGSDSLDGGAGDDTVLFGHTLDQYALTDFGSRIVVSGPDGTDTLTGIEHLQFADGTITPHDGDALFDTVFYLRNNLDVFHAGVNALAHFNTFGRHEGRDPNAFFDTSGYLAVNKDIGGANPLDHYRQAGWHESRDPGISFDVALYLIHNPDVAAAGVDPLEHYLQFGASEGRKTHTAVGHVDAGFDAQYYLFVNADVAAAGVDAHAHFKQFGWQEGRDPNGWFDTSGYLAHYADVAAAGVNPLEHYLQFGWKEGRDPSVRFDTLQYLAANPDVAAAQVNPLAHFLSFGIYEGRQAINDGMWD